MNDANQFRSPTTGRNAAYCGEPSANEPAPHTWKWFPLRRLGIHLEGVVAASDAHHR